MHIERIRLENFRCFEAQTFELAKRFNLVVGDNGAGKSSLLEGIAFTMLGFLHHIGTNSGLHGNFHTARMVTHWHQGTPTVEVMKHVLVQGEYRITGQPVNWNLTLGPGFRWELHSPDNSVRTLLINKVTANDPVILPVLGYYRATRRWNHHEQGPVETLAPGSRFLGYSNWQDCAANESRLLSWFKTKQFVALQKNRSLPEFDAVRFAIRDCVPNATDVYWDIEMDQLAFQTGERILWFRQLSDGYRSMVAMVADLAERCVTLNPHLGSNAIRQTPGCILIDELDLHLHPQWQRIVVQQLMTTFPQIQFIATTHSPFIIQSLPPGEEVKLLNLDEPSADDFANQSVEDIAENVQQVDLPQRSQRWRDMYATAERYYQLLAQAQSASPEELQKTRDELDRLMMPFSDDPAYQALLKQQRVASGIDGRNGHATS